MPYFNQIMGCYVVHKMMLEIIFSSFRAAEIKGRRSLLS